MIKSTRTDVMTTYKSIRNLSACVEKRGRVGMGGWLQFGRGKVGWGRIKGRKRRNKVSAEWVYIATSLYGVPGFNPLVILLVKSSEKNPHHHTVATFQKNYIICW